MNANSIHEAAASGDLPSLQLLLATGSSIEEIDANGATPLFVAACYGRLEVVQFFLKQGANVDAGNQVNYAPLMTAAREKHLEVVEALLKAKADPEIQAQGMKAIHWSLMDTIPKCKKQPFETESRLIEILKVFKHYGANLNTKGERGNTPLMDAAWWGLVYVTEFLLQQGANPIEKDNDGHSAEDYAKKKLGKNIRGELNERCEKIIGILSKKDKKSWWRI